MTNPPFSLFREYIKQLLDYDKKFIVLGNLNAITYNVIFPSIKENKLWLGAYKKIVDGVKFYIPEDYNHTHINEDNRKLVRVPTVRWFTNVSHNKRNRKINLSRKYTSELYPEYDNYHAIEVSKVADIPEDYDGIMGVPITFLDKYNSDQFEIVGINKDVSKGKHPELKKESWNGKFGTPVVDGQNKYDRIFIKHKR